MKQKNILKNISIICAVIGVISFPFNAIALLFGLAGSDTVGFVAMTVGYLTFIASSIIGIWKKRFFYGIILGLVIAMFGAWFDQNFWNHENEKVCLELQQDPLCIKSESGFQCDVKSQYFVYVPICNSMIKQET